MIKKKISIKIAIKQSKIIHYLVVHDPIETPRFAIFDKPRQRPG